MEEVADDWSAGEALHQVGEIESLIIAVNALSDCGKVERFFAEHLLNFRLQMGRFGATEESLAQTKPGN
jgi:hypothetical protein